MYPHERSLVKQLAGEPFALIGVNSDRDREKLKEVLKEKNLTWRSFWNGPEGTSGPISKKWGVHGWPTIYIMDAEGTIHYKGHGGPQIDETITKLLADMGHPVTLVHEDEGEKKGDADKGDADKGDADKGDADKANTDKDKKTSDKGDGDK